MIDKARTEQTSEIRELWKICFPKEDPRYIDFYFKNIGSGERLVAVLYDCRRVCDAVFLHHVQRHKRTRSPTKECCQKLYWQRFKGTIHEQTMADFGIRHTYIHSLHSDKK